jgi:predicted PurR-regulated permease PerM
MMGAAAQRRVPLAAILATVGIVVATGLALIILWVLRIELLYVLVACFVAVLLSPPVWFLERRGLNRPIAATIVFSLGLCVFAGLVFLFGVPLVSAVTRFAHQAPDLVRQAEHGQGQIGHLIKRFNLQNWVTKNSPKLTSFAASLSKPALSVGAAAISTLFGLVTIAILSFFLLLEAPSLRRGFLNLLSDEHAERTVRVAREVSRSVSGYMLGNALSSIVAGVVVFITLVLLGVPFALLLALWVALIDLLPIVGGLLAGIPTVVIALLHSPTAGIVTLIVFLVYQQIENHVLNPVIMSKTVRLSPLWVLLAVLVGAKLGSQVGSALGTIIGALIGIPVGGALQIIVRELRATAKGSPGTIAAPEVPAPGDDPTVT